jgi:hypothetical protein
MSLQTLKFDTTTKYTHFLIKKIPSLIKKIPFGCRILNYENEEIFLE